MAKTDVLTTYKDPDKERFYVRLKQCFPDFYTAFKKARIPEGDRGNPRKDNRSKFHKVYTRVEEEYELAVLSIAAQEAKEGKSAAVTAFMKDVGRRRSESDPLLGDEDREEIVKPQETKPRGSDVEIDEVQGTAMWKNNL